MSVQNIPTDVDQLYDHEHPELTVVMPCLNEVLTVGVCIEKAQRCIAEIGIEAEIIIADNGSTDGSVALAESLGARVVHQPRKGYGAALKAGIAAAKGRYIIMGDCDDSYDFLGLSPFVEKLREDYFLVMGNRFSGGIKHGAMPPLHRYFGNPLLTFLGRTLFHGSTFGDFYCGLRGFRADAVRSLSLHSDGMEFALEMVIKFTMRGDWSTEVPTTLSPDGRNRAPHLKSFRDGWRSLRFYLVMAPRWLYGIPGLVMFTLGGLLSARLFVGPLSVGDIELDYHALIYASTLMTLGYQTILLGIFAKLIAVVSKLHPPKTLLGYFRKRSSLVLFGLSGFVLILVGGALAFAVLSFWSQSAFADIEPGDAMRLVIGSVMCLLLGAQTVFAGFFFGLFNLISERQAEVGHEHAAPTA
jgi:glycosyltransferase involved in cell wall biosynthesis